MARFDLQSLVITAVAASAALSTGWWMNLSDDRSAAPAAAFQAAAIAAPAGNDSARVPLSGDGHFWADADIQGRPIRLLIDTGSTVVALTREDAARLGFEPAATEFTRPVRTASGPARAATVRLGRVSIAGVSVSNVEALVIEDGLPHSLLGMSYLGRLSRFEATPGALTLHL